MQDAELSSRLKYKVRPYILFVMTFNLKLYTRMRYEFAKMWFVAKSVECSVQDVVKVKVKLSVCLLKRHVMNTYADVVV
jgi:hypothetical protein